MSYSLKQVQEFVGARIDEQAKAVREAQALLDDARKNWLQFSANEDKIKEHFQHCPYINQSHLSIRDQLYTAYCHVVWPDAWACKPHDKFTVIEYRMNTKEEEWPPL